MKTLVAIAVGLAAVLVPSSSQAHNRSTAFSTWRVDDSRVTAALKLSALDVSALVASDPALRDDAALASYVARSFEVRTGETPCRIDAASVWMGPPSPDGWYRAGWTLACSDPGPLSVHVDLLFDIVAGHVHFARIEAGGITSAALDAGHRTVSLAEHRTLDLLDYARLGVEHIAHGWDHLVFLLVLLVAVATLRELAMVLTGFTVGHTFALLMAASGWARPPPAAIELWIALSIAVVAIEAVWSVGKAAGAGALAFALTGTVLVAACVTGVLPPLAAAGAALFLVCYAGLVRRSRRPRRLRAALAASFGIVHGFGFAAILDQLTPGAIAAPLLSFNAGIEVGQLALAACVWPLLAWLRRRVEPAAIVRVAAAFAMACACYWLVVRLAG